jgi:hypothetical protein
LKASQVEIVFKPATGKLEYVCSEKNAMMIDKTPSPHASELFRNFISISGDV